MDENSISTEKTNTNASVHGVTVCIRIPIGRKEQIIRYIADTKEYRSVSDFCRMAVNNKIESLMSEGRIEPKV